jgi:RND family efflux transporter MFP subunit
MKQIFIISLVAVALTGCGKGAKEKKSDLLDKQKELADLKTEKDKINTRIKKLQEEIAKLDSSIGEANKAKLVRTVPVYIGSQSSSVNLQGRIEAENSSYISPRGMGGQVKQIFIKKGDYVRVGTPVLRLDDAIIRQNILAAKKGLETITVQQGLAKTLYNRQKSLWEQNIGAEIQVIQAKANVDALEKQMRAAEESVKVAEEQQKTTMVYSDVAGFVEEVNVRPGELFAGVSGFGAQIKVVNTSSLKATVVVPESYITRIGRGSRVLVTLPDLGGKTVEGVISFTSMNVDPNQRGFTAEVRIPADGNIKPNMLAQIKVVTYVSATNAQSVPINIVQKDDKGSYVLIAEKSSNGKLYAIKRSIKTGQFFGDLVEVTGLKDTDQIIIEGYQNIYEGQLLKQ